MSDVSREKVDTSQIELIDALEHYRKMFSTSYNHESMLEDLSFDFHDINDKTLNFIRAAMRHIEELESLMEKENTSSVYESSLYDSFPSKHLVPIQSTHTKCTFY